MITVLISGGENELFLHSAFDISDFLHFLCVTQFMSENLF